MNWRKHAAEELRDYGRQKQSLENMDERLRALEYKATAIKSSSADSVPVQGGGSKTEDAWIGNIMAKDYVVNTRKSVEIKVNLIEKSLDGIGHFWL